ncbi:10880_t:CDS:2, partial [Cetraspora pellucida]
MSNTFFRTDSGRVPPNQEEIYQNISISSEDELSSIVSINTENFVSFDFEIIEEPPPAYDTITQNTTEQISEEQREENTNIDANYLTEHFATELQPFYTEIKLLKETI